MNKGCIAFLLIMGTVFSLAAQPLPKEGPFWRTKDKAFKRVTDERAILVSVRAQNTPDKKKRELGMVAGGQVNVPLDRAYAIARDYNQLKEVSSHFQDVLYDKEKSELYIHGVAFKYHAIMTLKLTERDIDAKNKAIEWRVVKGSFLGMHGKITFEDHKQKSLMGLESFYAADKLPLPEFFVEFALEVVIQRVASLMRKYIEDKAKTEVQAKEKQET